MTLMADTGDRRGLDLPQQGHQAEAAVLVVPFVAHSPTANFFQTGPTTSPALG